MREGRFFGGYDGPIYSPSQTQVYRDCPLAWFLRYNSKYVPKYYSQKEIAGAVGSAFSTYQQHIEEGIPTATDMAVADLHAMINALQETRICSDRATGYETLAEGRLHKFINLFNKSTVIPSSWHLFDRERAFEDYGHCRVDSMYETSMGDLGVLDYKTRGRIQANQVDKARREFGVSNQMYQYCAVASDVYGKLVNQFSILILTLEPKPFVDLWQYRVKPQFIKVWVAGRIQDWQDMTAIKEGKRVPSPATEHENKFGQCSYFDICFKHGFVEEYIDQDFIIRS